MKTFGDTITIIGDKVGNVEGVHPFDGEIVGANIGEYAVRDNATGEFHIYTSRELHWDVERGVWVIG